MIDSLDRNEQRMKIQNIHWNSGVTIYVTTDKQKRESVIQNKS